MPEEPSSLEQLEPPEPVEVVSTAEIDERLPASARPDSATLAEIDARVTAFVEALTEADVHTKAFEQRIAAIHSLGNKEIREAAEVSNRLLNRPIRGLGEESEVSKALLELRRTVEKLDPARQETAERKLLGIIPMGTRVNNYFRSYQSAQDQIDAVLNSLYHGQDALRKDVAAIEQEKVNLWQMMKELQQVIHATRQLDTALELRLAEIEAEDPEKARIVKEEVLFYVRQKEQDLLTQLAVSVQGYLALDVIRKNDLELIKGVDRATTTTISALRTAVIVAQALSSQKLVLDQISALNTTTGDLIATTSSMLQEQSGEIHEQAASATVDMEQLRTAFQNVFQTLDMISEYKAAALDRMTRTISLLSAEVEKATAYMDRVRSEQAIESTGDLLPLEDQGK
ncbi:MAG: toxic anion resistance protein [Anaerolineae bacterium]